jgi:phosphoenolpyruvate synthase/pyruvate phosphate dikinase
MNYQLFNQAVSTESEADKLGKKAKNLIELFSIGFDVPMGLVLSECPQDFSFLTKLIEQIGGFPVAVAIS